ncbi:hypothetical protein ILUMI_13848 [Ignelater luminosus]|uniref:MULE transposase domain-containing protein n=1 Tax=Ignelater luminosus TaxID=2038154 RepID=A0A8K0CTM4_IGNLU|nr:hypothetical protein ILUMI_13848 [Ignelater luminosus]
MELEVGREFSSYDELTDFISAYEKNKKQKYWKRSSRIIKSVRLRKQFNELIRYYEIHYSCIHGGTQFKSKGQGIKKVGYNTSHLSHLWQIFTDLFFSTRRMNCPANTKLRAISDGQSLEIRSFVDKYEYHELSKQALKRKDDEDLSKVVELIEKKYKGSISILDEEKIFKGLFISTPEMERNMEAWPEFLAFDGTYKLLKNGCTVYIFLFEDSNGESRIAGVGILSTEDKDTITWLIRSFKSLNPKWTHTKCIMTDKDLVEREVLKTEFPVSCDKLGISKSERDLVLEYIVKSVYSKTPEEYNNLYEEFSRWTKQFSVSQSTQSSTDLIEAIPSSRRYVTSNKKRRFLSLSEKRKNATLVANELVSLVSYLGNTQFDYSMATLRKILHLWRDGKEVTVDKADLSTVLHSKLPANNNMDQSYIMSDESPIQYDAAEVNL